MPLNVSIPLRILGIILVVAIGFASYLFVTRSNPVVYRNVDKASVEHSAFIIQNPFRDAAPERAAEAVLRLLQSRSCQKALALRTLDSDRVEYLCEREQKYPLTGWSMMDRTERDQKIQLVYNTYRNYGGEIHPGVPVWIAVEEVDGSWQATSYETYY